MLLYDSVPVFEILSWKRILEKLFSLGLRKWRNATRTTTVFVFGADDHAKWYTNDTTTANNVTSKQFTN